MKTKTIGIVLTKMDSSCISGYLGKLEANEIIKIFFSYYPNLGYYKIYDGTFGEGKEVGKQLEKIGIKNLRFNFNNEIYTI